MARKLTEDDWDEIQKNQPSRYFIHSPEHGKLRVVFESEIVQVGTGEEDLVGNIWEHEWAKNEAKVSINGESKIYSMGGAGWSFIQQFISVCKKNGIKPSDIPASVFDITKTGDWTQEIEYIGRAEDIDDLPESKQDKISIKNNIYEEVVEVIKDIKKSNPKSVNDGIVKADFQKAMRIRAKIKLDELEGLLPILEEKGIIQIVKNRIFVV